MNNQEAIEIMKDELKCYTGECQKRCYECNVPTNEDIAIAYKMAISALEKQEKYEAQWHDDMGNPLEPIKITSALNSEIMKLEYRKRA